DPTSARPAPAPTGLSRRSTSRAASTAPTSRPASPTSCRRIRLAHGGTKALAAGESSHSGGRNQVAAGATTPATRTGLPPISGRAHVRVQEFKSSPADSAPPAIGRPSLVRNNEGVSTDDMSPDDTSNEKALPGWTHAYSGKVRDLYVEEGQSVDTAERMLVVASDRVSAFDYVLSPGIPGKGELLTTLSLWWFDQLDGIPNHLVADHELRVDTVADLIPDAVAGRAMLVRSLEMFPIECVVRGYLVGSGWVEYQQTRSVCGVALPAGLSNGDRLPEPIYTPAFKAELGEHDENISFERTVELVGAEAATALRELSLEIFRRASAIAEKRGVILADTKFEFGRNRETGVITLADEV